MGDLYATLGKVIPGTPPSRACRPETTEFARFIRQQARPLWNRAVARMEAILPLAGVAILAETDPIRYMRLVQTLAILFYERECFGRRLTGPGVSASRIVTAKSSCQRPTEHVSEVLGWPSMRSAQSLAKRLKPEELRDILEYILCVDYGVSRPSTLDRLGEDGSRSFAYVAALLFEFIQLCDKKEPSLNELMEIQTACDTVHVWAQAVRLNPTDLTVMLLGFRLCSNLVMSESEWIEGPLAPEDLSLAPSSVVFIPDHGKSSRHGLITYSGYLERLVDALRYSSGGSFVPGARQRLLRKLSVDLNDMIPSMVFDGQRRDTIVSILKELAHANSIAPLALDKAYPPPVPEPDAAFSIIGNLTEGIAEVARSFLAGGSKMRGTSNNAQDSPVAGGTNVQQGHGELTESQTTYSVCTAAVDRFSECVALARGRWILEERSSQRQKQERDLMEKLDKERLELQVQELCASEIQETEEQMRWQLVYKEEVEDDESLETDPEEFMVESPVQAQATALTMNAANKNQEEEDNDDGEDQDQDEGSQRASENWELIRGTGQSA